VGSAVRKRQLREQRNLGVVTHSKSSVQIFTFDLDQAKKYRNTSRWLTSIVTFC